MVFNTYMHTNTNTNTTERVEAPGPWLYSIYVMGCDLRPGERITVNQGLPVATVAECGTRTVEDCGVNGPHKIRPNWRYPVQTD